MQDRKWNVKILKPESLTPLVQLLSYEVVEFSFTETHNDIEHKIRKKKKKKKLFSFLPLLPLQPNGGLSKFVFFFKRK